MCGVAGVYRRDRAPVAYQSLERLAERLARRGPDGEGIHAEPGVGLVHRRLAVIDLSEQGRQPMSDESGELWLTFNGELYNYRDLRAVLRDRGHRFRSDTDAEVLLHLYEDFPDELDRMLFSVRGMFAFGIWDRRRRRLVLGRDRLGIKPLFIHETPGGLSFASDLDTLLSLPETPRRLSPAVAADYLSLLSVPGPASLLEGVEQLPPGTVLIADEAGTRRQTYWALDPQPPELADETTAAEELESTLSEAVRLHLVADVEVGAFLSGGIDSSLVTAFAARIATGSLRTFSASFPGAAGDEGAWARETAARLGCEHVEIAWTGRLLDDLDEAVAAMDQPLGTPSALPLFRLAREARRALKVVLTGDGGDELFAGYSRHRPLPRLPAKVAWVPEAVRPFATGAGTAFLRGLRGLVGARADRGLWLLSALGRGEAGDYAGRVRVVPFAEARTLLAPDLSADLTVSPFEERLRGVFKRHQARAPLARMLLADIETTLVDEMLAKCDRMTMAWGLEARVPLLDHRVVELALRMAPSLLRDDLQGKRPLRRLALGRLGPSLAHRPKQGFDVPLARGLRCDPATRAAFDSAAQAALASGVLDRSGFESWRSRAQADDGAVPPLFAATVLGLWARQRRLAL